jgi:uncharacterized protein YpmS
MPSWSRQEKIYFRTLELYNLRIILHKNLFCGQNQNILIWKQVWFIKLSLLCRVKYCYRLLVIAHKLPCLRQQPHENKNRSTPHPYTQISSNSSTIVTDNNTGMYIIHYSTEHMAFSAEYRVYIMNNKCDFNLIYGIL